MFCPMPFNEFQIGPEGDVHCCCEDWISAKLGNILASDPASIWNGEIVRDIRRTVVDGNFHYCTRCPFLPGPGGPIVEGPSQTLPSGRIRTLVLNYDRSCNLACPSCRPEHLCRPASDPIVTRIHDAVLRCDLLRMTDRLYLSGSGDPLASPTYWKLLLDLPDLPRSPNLSVILLTNGLLLDEMHWEKLGRTRPMIGEINVSVDAATEATYLKLRGGSWTKLWQNLELVSRLRRGEQIRRFTTYFVVQESNFTELPVFVEKSLAVGADAVNAIFFDRGIRNAAAFDDNEYRRRAVHFPDHPRHSELRAVLSDPRVTDPRVLLPTFPPARLP